MNETVTIHGILESLPPPVAEDLRREAARSGRGVEELIREGILEATHRCHAASVAPSPCGLAYPPNLGGSGNGGKQG